MNPYRNPAERLLVKKETFWDKTKKGMTAVYNTIKWFFFDSPFGFGVSIAVAFAVSIFAIAHSSNAGEMHIEHDQFVLRQEICRIHRAWYTPSQNFGNLIACHRLDDHSLFYVFTATGLELVPHEIGAE